MPDRSSNLAPPAPPLSPLARRALAVGIVVLAIAAAHQRFLAAPFVFDDFGSVVENETIRQLRPAAWLYPPLDSGAGGRPLANFSFALSYAAGGLDPGAFRLGNLLLHGLAALLLFGASRRLFLAAPALAAAAPAATPLALAIAALWAVHPLATAAVASVAQRTELLAAACVLATVYCFLRYVASPRPGWAIAAIGASAAGMAAKETAVVAPVVVLALDRLLLAGGFRAASARRGPVLLALFATWGLLAWLMGSSSLPERGIGTGQGVGVADYALTQATALLLYLKLSFWPHPLIFDYGWTFVREPLAALPSLAGLAGLGAAVILARHRLPALAFAGLAWLLLLAPTSSLVPIVQQPMAENRAYLPLALVVSAISVALHRLLGRIPARTLLCLGSIAIALGCVTRQRAAAYQTEVALWADTVGRRPGSARAHGQLGAALLRAGRTEASLAPLQTAVSLRPEYTDARVNLGNAFAQLGRDPEAEASYRGALPIEPQHPEAHYNLGVLLARTGRAAEALPHFEAVLRRRPRHAQAHTNLAVVLLDLSRGAEAIAPARAAVALDPGLAEAHYNLGNALARLGDNAAALSAMNDAIRLKPDFARAHHNRGVLLLRSGRIDDARASFETALRLRPDYAEARRSRDALGPR